MGQGSYEARLLRVLDYIFENPAGDLSLDALADVAAMSRFHWHRVYHGMTGETCAQAVRRIRMNRAAAWLVQSDLSIETIATRVGVPNAKSFARIFRETYAVTPSEFRKRGEFRPRPPTFKTGDTKMFDVAIESFPQRRLAGMPHKGSYMEIDQVFERVAMIVNARSLWPQVGAMIGIYYDDPCAVAEEDLRSVAGVELAGDLPEGLEPFEIPAGRFAVLRHTGPYTGLMAAYEYLYGEWLPQSGEEPRDAPASEIYRNTPAETAPADLITDICLPIR
ncbi:MAG: AraC family transcriptional regulator [Pseudomonadota bacterium]